jgi:hypothetical protein
MDIKTLLFLLGAICFALDAFHVLTPRVSWTPLGFCFLTVAAFLV